MPVKRGNVKHGDGFGVRRAPLPTDPEHPVATLSELFTMLSHAAAMR
jgi:hypothetical protein